MALSVNTQSVDMRSRELWRPLGVFLVIENWLNLISDFVETKICWIAKRGNGADLDRSTVEPCLENFCIGHFFGIERCKEIVMEAIQSLLVDANTGGAVALIER